MKNTMKKLLCMTLVIMLLISAVPAFAMADDFGDDLSSVFVEEDFGESTVFSDSTTTSANDTTTIVSDTADAVADEGAVDSVKVYAKLLTANSTGTQFKTAASISNKNLKGSVTLNSVLLGASYLNQGATDSSTGITQSQLYRYSYVTCETKSDYDNLDKENAYKNDAGEVGEETLDGVAAEGTAYVVFFRTRIQFDVTLELEESDYAPVTIQVNAFDVLNVPNAFSSNGLKPASGSYIYMYADTIDTNRAIGTSYRITQNCTIVGKQDLLSNKTENDKNGVGTGNSTTSGSGSSTGSGSTGSGSTGSNKFPYPVYLNIYKDTLVGSPDKRVEITKGIALDGVVTLSEVKNVVKNYYTAKDSDGISYDGLYIAEGNWVANYVADTGKYDSIDAGSMSQTGTVYINVMIGNAKVKSTATADASNPKTGDEIFVPIMVMGLTASALAAAYVIGKKRFAR